MLYIKSKRDEVDVIECNWQLSNYEMAIRDDTYDHNSSIPFLEIGLIFTFMNTNVFNLH